MDPIIPPFALAVALDSDSPPVVLDVRWRLAGPPAHDDYVTGHLPGAVFVDVDRDLAAPPGPGGRHPLPDAAAFQDAMRRYGVRDDGAVVVYDVADGASAAARAWWLLRYFGHADVRVLDGGLTAWLAAGLPVTTDVPDVPPGDFVARPGGLPVVDADGAAAIARDGVLLDARVAARYQGDVEPIDPVAGRIPGAVNAPPSGTIGDGGVLLPSDVLRERFAALGADGSRPVGAYCGSGVTAAQLVLALDVAGVPAALYAGSWSDWITDPSRPVRRGR
jgi:thiosulfate/3-mercaptopyruvate sulfurtransferase